MYFLQCLTCWLQRRNSLGHCPDIERVASHVTVVSAWLLQWGPQKTSLWAVFHWERCLLRQRARVSIPQGWQQRSAPAAGQEARTNSQVVCCVSR